MFADELYKHPQADKTSLLEGGLTSLLALAGPLRRPPVDTSLWWLLSASKVHF